MRILIVKTSSLGDIIQALSILGPLKVLCPESEIDWVVEEPFMDLVSHHPLIRQAIAIHSKKWRRLNWKGLYDSLKKLREKHYDLIIDLQGNIKSSLVLLAVRGKTRIGFGSKSVPEKINLLVTNEKYDPPIGLNRREDYLYVATSGKQSRLPDKPIPIKNMGKIAIAPGSNWPNKQISYEAWITFLTLLEKKYDSEIVLIWGSEAEKKLALLLKNSCPSLKVLDKQPLLKLAALFKEMDLVIAMDSLPLHLAGSLGIPTFALFGPSLAAKYNPLGGYAFQGVCPYGVSFETRCPHLRTCATGACLKGLTGETLFDEFEKTIRSSF